MSSIEQYREGIWKSLKDYFAHTTLNKVYEDISDDFVDILAFDSYNAKAELRKFLSRSSAWNDDLQAIVINGTRTHDPNYSYVRQLAEQILFPAKIDANSQKIAHINRAIRFFTYSEDKNGWYVEECIDSIKALAPKAYRRNKKRSRVFKSLCDALGVSDDTRGSQFQRLFALLADELNGRKLDFKLFLSIHPAHFLTMSNPKEDMRGSMLTSCHSFNSTEYEYNCGCIGYARDSVTMIAFTVNDPDDSELLNNRKATRQLFMYKPHGGLLLQSRLYNTSGGTEGEHKEADLYRDLVQREISLLEGYPNLWKTERYFNNSRDIEIDTGDGFGGYPDWIYKDFNAKISIHAHHLADYDVFSVGKSGLCIHCGKLISEGLYCCTCKQNEQKRCARCRCETSDLYSVHDHEGEYISVCEDCLQDFELCDECDEYWPSEMLNNVHNGYRVCDSCLEDNYTFCSECGEYYREGDENMHTVCMHSGRFNHVCQTCYEHFYEECAFCGRSYNKDYMLTAYDSHGNEVKICDNCRTAYYEKCEECGRLFDAKVLKDGLCKDCRK